jgi:hypothetical protein
MEAGLYIRAGTCKGMRHDSKNRDGISKGWDIM